METLKVVLGICMVWIVRSVGFIIVAFPTSTVWPLIMYSKVHGVLSACENMSTASDIQKATKKAYIIEVNLNFSDLSLALSVAQVSLNFKKSASLSDGFSAKILDQGVFFSINRFTLTFHAANALLNLTMAAAFMSVMAASSHGVLLSSRSGNLNMLCSFVRSKCSIFGILLKS